MPAHACFLNNIALVCTSARVVNTNNPHVLELIHIVILVAANNDPGFKRARPTKFYPNNLGIMWPKRLTQAKVTWIADV